MPRLTATGRSAATRTNLSAVSLVEQEQAVGGTNAGFGEFANVRYRGQGFIPTQATLSAIAFQRNVGSKGIKVYIDTANASSIPINAVGSELYSFTIPNASLSAGMKKYDLPTPLTVTPGTRYCFYLASWDTDTNAYADDYQDMQITTSSVYSGGAHIKFESGAWAAETGDTKFRTYTSGIRQKL